MRHNKAKMKKENEKKRERKKTNSKYHVLYPLAAATTMHIATIWQQGKMWQQRRTENN